MSRQAKLPLLFLLLLQVGCGLGDEEQPIVTPSVVIAATVYSGTTGLTGAATLRRALNPEYQDTRQPRLQELVGTWLVIESTFASEGDTTQATMVGASAAGSRALYTVWRQGSGDTRYEANALWGYDSASEEVRVFEVNSVGVVATHIGGFDSTGALVLELRDLETDDLLQHRVFTWAQDTLRIGAQFYSNGTETRHSVTLIRQ